MEGVAEQLYNRYGCRDGYVGPHPYVNTIATFDRRCFEQIAVDLCLQNLPVGLAATVEISLCTVGADASRNGGHIYTS